MFNVGAIGDERGVMTNEKNIFTAVKAHLIMTDDIESYDHD